MSEEQKLKRIIWANNQLVRLMSEQHGGVWSCSVDYRQGYPRFSISRLIEDRFNTLITLALTGIMLEYILNSIEELSDPKNIVTKPIEITANNHIYVDGEKSDKLTVSGIITIFKENDTVYLKFSFDANDYRLADKGINSENNKISFIFPVKHDKYFNISDDYPNLHYAKAYSSLLRGISKSYSALFIDRYRTSES